MKKTLIALAALAAGTAFAQSTVTLSGGVAVGLQHTAAKENGTASKNGLSNLDAAGNNVTFTAVEDLGGGLKASAAVNIRFDPTNGANAGTSATDPKFAQNVKLAVAGGFGEVAAGRFNAPADVMRGAWDLFNAAGAGGAIHGHSGDAPTRYNGTLQYTTPVFSGFKAAVATTFKANTPANTTVTPNTAAANANTTELALTYVNGPVNAGIAFTKNAASTSAGISVKDRDVVTLGGSYDFGVAKVGLTYSDVKNDQTVAADDYKRTSLHVSAPVASNIILKAGFERMNTEEANKDTTAFAAGVDYILSKRTKVIFDVWKKNADSAAAASDDKSINYVLGLKHTF